MVSKAPSCEGVRSPGSPGGCGRGLAAGPGGGAWPTRAEVSVPPKAAPGAQPTSSCPGTVQLGLSGRAPSRGEVVAHMPLRTSVITARCLPTREKLAPIQKVTLAINPSLPLKCRNRHV